MSVKVLQDKMLYTVESLNKFHHLQIHERKLAGLENFPSGGSLWQQGKDEFLKSAAAPPLLRFLLSHIAAISISCGKGHRHNHCFGYMS